MSFVSRLNRFSSASTLKWELDRLGFLMEKLLVFRLLSQTLEFTGQVHQ